VMGGRRDEVKEALAAAGIETMIYYPKCMHELPVYAGAGLRFPEAERAAQEVLSLPLWPRITLETQERVALALRRAVEAA
jgi:dTDP-4-amino-4,6-dideoxygalactose transaminase